MDRSRFTTEALISRWEERRALKNLMGKYINCLALNREAEIFAQFWARDRDDVSLGLNDGIYRGHAAVQGYYSALHNKNLLVSRLGLV